ncbi:MAG: hypothetical protein ABL890_04595 [Candidatus Peribacteraceae bacterium]
MQIQHIAILGLIINLACAIPYIRDTLIGKTQPNRVSYFLWFAIPLIGIAASWSEGVTWALVPVISASLIPFSIFLASFFDPRAYWRLRPFDYLCGALSILALVLWYVTNDASVAIVLSIIADLFASIPTVVKLWKYPDTETKITYAAGLMSAITGLFTLSMWSIFESAFPLYLIFMNGALFTAAFRGMLLPSEQAGK